MNLTMTYKWNRFSECWMVDISDESGTPIVNSIPIVTGCDLFNQFGYLQFGGQLTAQTDGDPGAVPTFTNLGTEGHVYFVAAP